MNETFASHHRHPNPSSRVHWIFHGYAEIYCCDPVQAAAGSGQLVVLEWLHEKQCPCDAWAFNMAAAHGNFEVLKWLHNKGYPWCPGTCDKAAEYH